MAISDHPDFRALDPFFRIIEQGLDGLAGPGHFFDLLAEDAVFEYVITVPGYPRRVEGRDDREQVPVPPVQLSQRRGPRRGTRVGDRGELAGVGRGDARTRKRRRDRTKAKR